MSRRLVDDVVRALKPGRLDGPGLWRRTFKAVVEGARARIQHEILDWAMAKDRERFVQSVLQREIERDGSGFFRNIFALSVSRDPHEAARLFTECAGGRPAYSQEGEDLLLSRFLEITRDGCYVDVGAHHPVRFSNTYALYLNGWSGINVDATPGSMAAFERLRPRDVNIECIVSDTSDPVLFHLFAEPALNTSDAALAAQYVEQGWESRGTVEVNPRSLADILEQHLPSGQNIDLMSIDVEGAEMQVLRSNNWAIHRPRWLVVEVLDIPLTDMAGHPVISFLAAHGYTPMSKLLQSVILKREA